MRAMSKAAALSIGRRAVCAPIKQHGGGVADWLVIGPYKPAEPERARTEQRCSSYPSAVHARAMWIAQVAMHAMFPEWGEDEDYALYEANDPHHAPDSARAILNRALEVLRAAK